MDVEETEQPAVKYGNGRGIPISQATIPQFFGNKGSKTGIAQESQPGTGGGPRRINPTRVDKETEIKGRPSVSFADQDNVMNETTASKDRTHSIIGETTISTREAQQIKDDVHAVMREQLAEGRAALRVELGAACRGSINIRQCST